MPKSSKARRSKEKDGELLKLREAALELCISFPTIKQWIYKRKFAALRRREGITVFRKVK